MRSFFVLALLCSAAHAQFVIVQPQRHVSVTAEFSGEFESRLESNRTMGEWIMDEAAGLDSQSRNFARAWQTSRISETELFVSGGVLTTGPIGVSNAWSHFSISFEVLNRPIHVRMEGALSMFATPNTATWNGGATFDVDPNVVLREIQTRGDEMVEFYPAGTFTVGEDGFARTSFDQTFFLQPGTYDFFVNASSNCPNHQPGFCDGRPIEYSAHLMVAPEPATWVLIGIAVILIAVGHRFVRRC